MKHISENCMPWSAIHHWQDEINFYSIFYSLATFRDVGNILFDPDNKIAQPPEISKILPGKNLHSCFVYFRQKKDFGCFKFKFERFVT